MRDKEKGQREPRVVIEFVVVLLANRNLLSRNTEGAAVRAWHRGVAAGGRKPVALLPIGSRLITHWHCNGRTVNSACVARPWIWLSCNDLC